MKWSNVPAITREASIQKNISSREEREDMRRTWEEIINCLTGYLEGSSARTSRGQLWLMGIFQGIERGGGIAVINASTFQQC